MSSKVSEGAIQLYEYMKANYEICRGEREFEVLGIYRGNSAFQYDYKVYLDELLEVRAIRLQGDNIITFRARLQPFVDLGKSQQTTESLTSRYQPDHQLQLEGLFRSFALQRESGKFSGDAIFKELKYYANFSIQTVMTSIDRYQNHSKQYGPPYFRGVLRGVDKEVIAAKSVVKVKVTPASEYEEKRKKAGWIRSKIDQKIFAVMTTTEQRECISQLEQDYANKNRQEAT